VRAPGQAGGSRKSHMCIREAAAEARFGAQVFSKKVPTSVSLRYARAR
jgi:hypothetical protein